MAEHVVVLGGGDRGAAPPRTIATASLPHPRSGEHSSYLLVDGAPYELQRVSAAGGGSGPGGAEGAADGSWLLAGPDSVQEDGSLLVASPIDPTFFVLSRLFAARAARAASTHGGRRERAGDEPARPLYEPLSDLLTNLDCPALCALAHAPGIGARLAPACDVNAKYADVLVRFDEAKALRWLRAKVAQIQARRPPLLVGDEARTHVVCAGTLDEHAPALRAGAGGAGTFAARPDASGAAPDAARAAREAVIGARAAVSDLSALALLAEYVRDDALQLVAQSYGLSVAQVRAEAAEPTPHAPPCLAPRVPREAAGETGPDEASCAAADAADAAAAAADAARAKVGSAPAGAAAGSARPFGTGNAPAAKKARVAPAIAALAKTDVRRMQPLTSFFAKK
ncbi:hypothetical protein KFE25_003691 [Diacronema lutheri]|uniref:Rnh202 triple barrel domain-containing protein n=1 Tax=Diacronema lutheri TaxID=2081491 RepID=A0A8J6C3V8_DIALT|nr:hypothetical protein KFE25_003691 [Diacronema lutheri]